MKNALIPKHEGHSKNKQNYENVTKYDEELPSQEPDKEEFELQTQTQFSLPEHPNISILRITEFSDSASGLLAAYVPVSKPSVSCTVHTLLLRHVSVICFSTPRGA